MWEKKREGLKTSVGKGLIVRIGKKVKKLQFNEMMKIGVGEKKRRNKARELSKLTPPA